MINWIKENKFTAIILIAFLSLSFLVTSMYFLSDSPVSKPCGIVGYLIGYYSATAIWKV